MIKDIDWSFKDYKPTSDKDFIENCLTSKLWRMNNLYKIKNKSGEVITLKLNPAQIRVCSVDHNRLVILKARQMGISTLKLIEHLDTCIFYPNKEIGIMAQGLRETNDLLNRAKFAWEKLPDVIKEFLGITETTYNNSEIAFNNNSKLKVGISFRSATLQALHVSELGKISVKDPERANELKTGAFQTIGGKNKITIESTAEGRGGLFYDIWNTAVKMKDSGDTFSEMDFYPLFNAWFLSPEYSINTYQERTEEDDKYFANLAVVNGFELTEGQKNFYLAKRRELGGHITQEYPSTPEEAFAAIKDGTYYSPNITAMRRAGRIKPNLYDPNLPVYVTMDLGINDDFVLLFYQTYNKEHRIIHCLANNRAGLSYYVDYLFSKKYNYGTIYVPHDATVRELTANGKTRQQILAEMGVKTTLLRRHEVIDGINTTRMMLDHTWIDSSCVDVIEALENYSKEWDEKNGVWKNTPKHDKYSHICDAVRYMAMSDVIKIKTIDVYKNRFNPSVHYKSYLADDDYAV